VDVLILAMKFYPASGGTTTYALNLARGLHAQGYRVLVLAPRYGRRRADDAALPFGVIRMRMASDRFPFLRYLAVHRYLNTALRVWNPQVIWATSFAGCVALGTLCGHEVPMVGTIHGGAVHRRYPSRNFLNRIGDRLGLTFMRKAARIVTVSRESRMLIRSKILDVEVDAKTTVIYNGIQWNQSKFLNREQAVGSLSHLAGKRVILTVSRLIAAKGHDLVLRALADLQTSFPDLAYVIVGEGPEKKRLQDLSIALGVSSRVHFAGYVSDEALEAYYGACDVFVMAGRVTAHFVEGFGLVLIEAGIRKRPVVSTLVGGIPEAVKHNETGLLIPPGDVARLTDALRQLLTNQELSIMLGENAEKFISGHFTTEVMSKNNRELLDQLNIVASGTKKR
jgi:phosphatidyl-myo-inositol dimannoside synthase